MFTSVSTLNFQNDVSLIVKYCIWMVVGGGGGGGGRGEG